MPDLSFLDNVEKILIVAGVVSLLAAATAPTIFGITWTAWSRRAVTAAGVLFLVLSFVTPNIGPAAATRNDERLRQAVLFEIKTKLSDLTSRAGHNAYLASTHVNNNLECVANSKAAMTSIDDIKRELDAFSAKLVSGRPMDTN